MIGGDDDVRRGLDGAWPPPAGGFLIATLFIGAPLIATLLIGTLHASQSPQQTEPTAHGGDIGTDPLEGERFPRREDLDPTTTVPGAGTGAGDQAISRPPGEGLEVVRQLVSGRPGRGHHQHRAAGTEPDEPGKDEGLGRGRHGQGGRGRADNPRHGGFVSEQRGE